MNVTALIIFVISLAVIAILVYRDNRLYTDCHACDGMGCSRCRYRGRVRRER